MDIQKHLKSTDFCLRELFFKFVPQQLNLKSPVVSAFLIFIRKEVAIHVLALQVRSVITSHNTIRVHSRQDPDFVHFSELVWQDVSGHKVIHKPMNDKAAMCFARVLAPNNNYNRFLFKRISIIVYVRNFYNWDVNLAQTFSQCVEPYKLIIF